MTEAAALIREMDLSSARARLVEDVKRRPSDPAKRLALAEVLILLGEWERADAHLDLASTQDPTWTPVAGLQRQLLRAAAHRDDTWRQGRPPELVTEPTPRIETALRILAAAREGGDAASLRREADERFAALSVEREDGPTAAGLRDGDDRTADVLEVLTSTGRYVWVSLDQISSLELRPVEQPRDLVWRAAELEVADGPTGVVYLPMIYPEVPGGAPLTDAQRLGRTTDWVEEAGGLTCGVGQRCWLMGDDLVAASEVGAFGVAQTSAQATGAG